MAHPSPVPPPRHEVEVAYGPLPEQRADICTPEGPGPFPGVVLIHGGGWRSGDKSDLADECRLLAAHGIVTMNIDYRLAPTHRWPDQLVDVQLAVRALRDQASRYRLDGHRLCSLGASAGGHLAVFLGVAQTIHPGDAAGLHPDQSPLVRCVVDLFGPVDLTQADRDRTGAASQLVGASIQADPAAYRDASPLFLVSPRSAPTFIVQGDQDDVVEPAQSAALQQALTSAQVAVVYQTYHGGHGFSGLSPEEANRLYLAALAFVQGYLVPKSN